MEIKNDLKFKTKTGWLCLDFANTVDWHASDNPEEKLTSYVDIVSWAKERKIVSQEVAEKLIKESGNEPKKAKDILNEAIRIREAIYRIFFKHSLL